MRLAMIDDEVYYRNKVMGIIDSNFSNVNIDFFDCINSYINCGKSYEILLLDIELPDMDGIAFAKTLKKENTRIIYISSHTERTYDAFAINVIGFINKDNLEVELIKKINDYIRDNHLIVFNYKNKKINILENEIVNILVFQKKVTVFTMDNEFNIDCIFKELKDILTDSFFLANRSEYINLRNIENIDKKNHTVLLVNNKKIEISRRNWNEFKVAYNRKVNE